ncbi:family 1 glycosylhydrolase [Nocardia sp. NPDC051981]|uniref:family 1 glycosylhydrolase n=1 Tax=Nocardia sp. NPDC051981 TaxID=3155417 RepID=UPI00342CF813
MRTRFRCLVPAGLAMAATLLLVPGAARTAPERHIGVLGDDFLWGVAAAGFQSEGQSPDSNWTRYIEDNPGWDRLGDSVDFHSRFRSDIALAENLGVKVFRIDVEWERLDEHARRLGARPGGDV